MRRGPWLISSTASHYATLQQQILFTGVYTNNSPVYSLMRATGRRTGQIGLLYSCQAGAPSSHTHIRSKHRITSCCSTMTPPHQLKSTNRHTWNCKEAAVAARLLISCCRACSTSCNCSPLQVPSTQHSSIRSLPAKQRGCVSRNSSFRSQHTTREVDLVSSSSSSSSSCPRPPGAAEITSAANPYIKHCVKLRQSAKYRQQKRRLLLVGSTILQELAEDATDLDVLVLFLRPGAATPSGITAQHVITVNDTVMKKLTGLEEAAGTAVAAELALPQYVQLTSSSSSSSSTNYQHSFDISTGADSAVAAAAAAGTRWQQQLQRLLVLEGVQDPGNLGTLLRCAAAFGWDAVWLLPGCCDPFNDKALRASRGAALRVPLAAGDLQQLLLVVKQQDMLLLAAEPEPEQQVDSSNMSGAHITPTSMINKCRRDAEPASLQRPVCLVLGNEGAGLSDEVLGSATPVAIPMSGGMESLNVGVAGAILMFALSKGMPQLMVRLQQLGIF